MLNLAVNVGFAVNRDGSEVWLISKFEALDFVFDLDGEFASGEDNQKFDQMVFFELPALPHPEDNRQCKGQSLA